MNMVSMMASHSVGILVDDFHRGVENIHRHLKMGASPKMPPTEGVRRLAWRLSRSRW